MNKCARGLMVLIMAAVFTVGGLAATASAVVIPDVVCERQQVSFTPGECTNNLIIIDRLETVIERLEERRDNARHPFVAAALQQAINNLQARIDALQA